VLPEAINVVVIEPLEMAHPLNRFNTEASQSEVALMSASASSIRQV